MESLKKILIISPQAIYREVPHAGGKTVYSYIKHFSRSNSLDLGILTLRKPSNISYKKMQSELDGSCRIYFIDVPSLYTGLRYIYYRFHLNIFLLFVSPRIFQLDPVSKHLFRRGLKSVQKSGWKPDIIIFEWTETMCLAQYAKMSFPDAKLVFSEHDVTYVKYERMQSKNIAWKIMLKLNVRRFKKYELESIREADRVVVQSLKDEFLLLEYGIPKNNIITLCPFFDKYSYNGDAIDSSRIIFWGAMNRPENIEAVRWFITNVFMRLLRGHSELMFMVVGGGNPLHVGMPESKNVVYTGYVEDPGSYFRNALCLVAPLSLGAGIKVKILEGLYSGVPVLTGYVGMEGIQAKPEEHYFHCETANDYEKAILSLLINPQRGKQMGKKAISFIQDHFDSALSLENYKKKLLAME